jgi:hypothetical protein
MAGNGKRGGGDRVLESRHLVSLFLGVVLLCGVFFTLGYVMGHNQYGGPVHAADSVDNGAPPVRPSVRPKDIGPPPAVAANPANNEWDFYSKKNNDDRMDPVAKPSVNAGAPSASVAARRTPLLLRLRRMPRRFSPRPVFRRPGWSRDRSCCRSRR